LIPKKYQDELEARLTKAGWMDAAWSLACSLPTASDPIEVLRMKCNEIAAARRVNRPARVKPAPRHVYKPVREGLELVDKAKAARYAREKDLHR